MRRLHYMVGLLGVTGFVLSGQALRFHQPSLRLLEPGVHMMYVSRHIYLLCASLVNLVLGLYLRRVPEGWRGYSQVVGSALPVASPLFLATAFLVEPSLGLAGRSWWSRLFSHIL